MARLRFITQTLLVAIQFHPLAALVLRNFCFAFLFNRSHWGAFPSDVSISYGEYSRIVKVCEQLHSIAESEQSLKEIF
ncbi:MAG: hypothetical protein K2W99_00270 [Chthoniobacterales bacterium]|nr:hypothetical protein [Chthoniobacterales bacterium]